MIRYSESVLRKRIAEVPDGSWSESNVIQGDEDWKICIQLTKQGDRLIFDFTGTDEQARSAASTFLPRDLRRLLPRTALLSQPTTS